MRTAFGLTLMTATGLVLGAAVTQLEAAPAVPLGQEGDLAKLVSPIDGRKTCYARTYDASHLRKHSRQQTQALILQLRYAYPEKREKYRQAQYRFGLDVQMKGRRTTLHTSGDCVHNDAKIRCGVECDGGGFFLELEETAGGLRLTIDERLRMGGCREEGDLDWTPRADDKVFRLLEANSATCRALDSKMDP